jgi:O-acetyl-ADP-ribose deacetylase
MDIELLQGDITKLAVDVIVNAANCSLLGGGGVDGAIHRAAGPSLLEECRKFSGCQTGEAVITGGGNLPASHVIHTPGPVWNSGNSNEPELLAACYRNSMQLAQDHQLDSMAFPCISTGVYGYPKELAAEIAVKIVREWAEDYPRQVVFCVFGELDYKIYQRLIQD